MPFERYGLLSLRELVRLNDFKPRSPVYKRLTRSVLEL